jgi:signal transduction histidine kinase
VEAASVTASQAPPALLARFFAGQPVVADLTKPPFDALPNPFGTRTFLVAPLLIAGEVVGLVSLDYGLAEHDYTTEEVALAGSMAQLAALTLERDRLQRERDAARARALALEETQKRMDEFLAIASHELRSPLTTIRGNLQLAQGCLHRMRVEPAGTVGKRHEELELVETWLQAAETQTTRQKRLIEDLVDLSRLRSGHLTLHRARIDLRLLLEECVEEHRLAWPARIVLLRLPEMPVSVSADSDRLGQVVTNVLSNALKYSAPDRPVEVGLQTVDGEALVLVRDEGPGLTPEQREQVWERYRRVAGVAVQDRSQVVGGGLGLGLYISRGIVEQHGGRVGVDSQPGAGSTFWFALPLA